ncbi:MAG: substrate-binding periplasmic protein [Legionella sp.]
MKPNFLAVLLVLWLQTLLMNTAWGDSVIRVGVLKIPPFAYQENGEYQGLALDLWSEVAKENQWKYRYVTITGDIKTLLDGLSSNSLDVVIGNISVTNERLKTIAFSRPFYISQICLIISQQSQNFIHILKNLLSNMIPYLYIVLLSLAVGFLLVYSIWWIEGRRVNNPSERVTLSDYTWNVILMFVTMSEIGRQYTILGRILVLILLSFSVAISGMLVAILSSALTVSMSKNQFNRLADMENKPVAVELNSYQEELAKKLGLSYLAYPKFSLAIKSLLDSKVVGIMDEIPSARYYFKSHNELNLAIAPFSLNYNEVAFAFQKKSPYLPAFDLSLTKMQGAGEMKALCKKYLSDQESDLCDL